MITPSSQRCEPFNLQMDALECLRTAPPLPQALLEGIGKVIRVVMIPFAFIVDLAINGVRVFVNVFISLANCLRGPPPIEDNLPPDLPINSPVSVEVSPSSSPLADIALEGVRLASDVLPLPEPPILSSQLSVDATPLLPFAAIVDEIVVDEAPPALQMSPQTVSPSVAQEGSPPPPYSAPAPSLATATTVSNASPVVTLPVCSNEEDQQIGNLLMKLVELGVLNAIPVGKELMKIGTSIKDVHPLTFLLMSVKTVDRVKNLKTIFGAHFKRYNFMSYKNGGPSLSEKLTLKAKEKDFNALLAEFAKQTNLSFPFAQLCARSQEWDKLVQHLVNTRR